MGDPLSHYTHHGAKEGISPSPYFDVAYYLDWNPALRDVKREIIKHYKFYGARNLRCPIPVFDPAYYLSQLEDPSMAEVDPLSSYVTMSDRQQCKPGPWFEPEHYRVAAEIGTEEEPLAHYLSQRAREAKEISVAATSLPSGPLISVLVPVYDPEISFLNNCVRSVLCQTYSNWELCLADDCSSNPDIRETLREWATQDKRIKVVFREENGGISAATNSAAELATGDYFGFLDNDDELSPECLNQVAGEIATTGAQVLYTDEDLIGNDGTRFSIFHKPDFNLGLLFSHNYITHFVVVESTLFKQVGGFDSRFDGAQDYDLMLRLTEHANQIRHIPQVLYNWRASQTSTSINHEQKSYAHEAGKNALVGALSRRGINGNVGDTGHNYFYRVHYDRASRPKVTVIAAIPHGKHDKQRELLENSSGYGDCEFQIVSLPPAASPELVVKSDPDRLDNNLSEEQGSPRPETAILMHRAALASQGEYLIFLAIEPVGFAPEWIEELMYPLLGDGNIGIVCGRIDSDGEGKQSFRIPSLSDSTIDYFSSFLARCTRHMNWLNCQQYVSFCDWDICIVKRSVFEELGGFDYENFPSRLAMLDFSMKAVNNGWKILYTPYALMHVDDQRGSQSLQDTEVLEQEKQRFQRKWKKRLLDFDRYYNLGILDEYGVDRNQFKHWLSGGSI
jgi:GT2 family glycosyltransferase